VPEGTEPGEGDRRNQGPDFGAADLTADERRLWLASLLRDHAYFRILWHNCHEVVPGRLYRSNHPTPWRLERAARRYRLRTVINLRGEKPSGSTELTEAVARRLGLEHVFLPFESRGAPQRDRVLRFHELYRSMRTPALMHCKSGADRAGLAAGLVMLFEGAPAAVAIRQLSLRYLHIRQSGTGILDAFFLRYAADADGKKPFLDWVREDYDEDDLRERFQAGGIASFVNDRLLARE
jgi:protein tyrosine/serine phosphatase